jgi:hypothetical protein
VSRGGRVVVVDPRRTETARAFEHVAVRPDGDAWQLLALLNVIFEEGLEDRAAIAKQSKDIGLIRHAARGYSPETVLDRTGVPADDVRALARAIATAPSAAIHGRTGACLGRHATLVNVLLDTLALVTGNLDRPGGLVFGRGPVDFASLAARLGLATYDDHRSRVGDFPEVLYQMPAPIMADEILQGPASAFDLAQRHAEDIFAVKILQSGGVMAAGRVGAIADAAGLGLYGGTMLEGAVSTVASAHVFAGFPRLDWGTELFGPLLLTEDILTEPLLYRDFHLHVSTAPGLGLAIDEERLAFFRRDKH